MALLPVPGSTKSFRKRLATSRVFWEDEVGYDRCIGV
ncbi:hypothetical protein HNQ36_005326 [Afipia massiliensis]|uniref:Uncharacterized protein n=1 Tax=Afipia massiliensis TaxID=211460 RepID=A0A840N4J7_9BRAD|nr:hypothetical protein [Afipia massiliensis]